MRVLEGPLSTLVQATLKDVTGDLCPPKKKYAEIKKTNEQKHYKTKNERGIYGHSLGGLFADYCLLNSKGIFNRYGINSPSLWWNNNEILNQADSLFSKNETWDILPTKVFISVGQKEGGKMVPNMVKFSTLLEVKAYKNVSLTWHLFEEETHLSVLPAALSRTLSVLYGTKK